MMNYKVVLENPEECIFIDKNGEGAFVLSAMVQDPLDTVTGPFYHTETFYFYEADEVVPLYIEKMKELNYFFVEEDY
jgi:hypothetical protein